MAVSIDLSKALDEAHEDKSLEESLDASPAAPAGISDSDAQLLDQAFGIKTVRDLGANKYFALAAVLLALSNKL